MPKFENAKKYIPFNLEIEGEIITQYTHPSIVDFKTEHNIEQWCGYRYWLVVTPYPYTDESYENPSICASNNGMEWVVPKPIKNPLDRAGGGLDNGFNSDPEMVYNPETDELWIYYRFLTHETYMMKLIKITNKLEVKKPLIIINKSPWDPHYEVKSMAIVREASDKWHMWAGTRSGYDKLSKCPPNNSVYLHSSDGIHWSDPEYCFNSEGIDPYYAIGYSNWHTSCKYNPRTNQVDFLCYCQSRIDKGNAIIHANCSLESPTILNCTKSDIIMTPSKSGWDNRTLYRCAFVIETMDDNDIYHVWYAGTSKLHLINKGFWLIQALLLKISPKMKPYVSKIPLKLYNPKWHIGYTKGQIIIN